MFNETIKTYNEMGDGFDETVVIYDFTTVSMSILHVGRFADEDMLSSTYTRMEDRENG